MSINIKIIEFYIKVQKILRVFWLEFKYRLNNNSGDVSKHNLLDQWKSISTEINVTKIDTRKKILFLTGYGLGSHYQTVEPIIISALRVRGVRVASLFCDKAVPACEFNINGNNRIKVNLSYRRGVTNSAICEMCNKCSHNIKEFYPSLGVDLHSLTTYLNDNDFDSARKFAKKYNLENFRGAIYNSVSIGEEAYSSILRATFKGEIEHNEENLSLVERYLVSGFLTAVGYERAMESIKPDKVVCIHGIYQTHGLAVKVADKLKIPVVVLGGGGIRKDTVVVCHGVTYHHQLIDENNQIWEGRELTDIEKDKVLKYAILKRSNGGGVDYISFHPNPIEDVEYLYDNFKITRDRKLISIYTNVIWDAQVLYKSNVFVNMFDWLWTTIDQLAENEKIWVLIRIHPAEKKGGVPTRQPVYEEIKKRYPILPSNVRIVLPENNLSSYVLAQNSHVNIIYGTKMGLEIALLKRALIICGETFSRNKGYGLDITSKLQYNSVLSSIESYTFDIEGAFERAVKYAYYFYFRRMINLPITTFSESEEETYRVLNFSSVEELLPGKHNGLDVICDGILFGTPFVLE